MNNVMKPRIVPFDGFARFKGLCNAVPKNSVGNAKCENCFFESI
jgi:hypothetical protein